MNLTHKERLELNALSTETFGKPSFWQKFWKNGLKKTAEEIKNNPNSSHYNYFHTFEEIKKCVVRIQTNTKELLEKMKADNGTNK